MLKSEVAELLTYRLGIEGTAFDVVNVEAWHTLLADVDHRDALTAAKRHYRGKSRRLWPADILAVTDPTRGPDGWMQPKELPQ